MSSVAVILKKEKYFLLILFFISLFIRLFFFSFLVKDKKYWVCKDSAEYNGVALQIVQGSGISNPQGEPTFFRVPGYSIFLALFYKIFNFSIAKTLVVQIFLSSFIPLFVFFLSLIFFPANFFLAKIAAVYMALSVGSVLNSALLMSDSLFVFFFLIFVLLFFSTIELFWCKKERAIVSWSNFLISGLILGVASLIRPVGHYLIILSMFLLFLSNMTFYDKIKSALILFLGWLCVVIWWLLRNWILTGAMFFHSMPGIHFLTYLACEVDCQANKCNYCESKNNLFNKLEDLVCDFEKQKSEKISEIERSNLASQLALQTVEKYPLIAIKHCFVNLFKTCFALHSSFIVFLFSGELPTYYGTTTLFQKIRQNLFLSVQNKWIRFLVYFEIFLLLFLSLGFLGALLLSLFDTNLLCQSLKCLPFICLFVALTFGSGVARLRLPIEPFIAIFTFYFWIKVFKLEEE